MKAGFLVVLAGLGAAFAAPALAQSGASITTTPGGGLSGSASAGAAPSVSVQAGGGRTQTEIHPPAGGYGSGRSVTVQGSHGSASAGAWSSEGGQTAVYGSGSPDSDIQYRSYGRGAESGYSARPNHDPDAVQAGRSHRHSHHRRALHRRWRGRNDR